MALPTDNPPTAEDQAKVEDLRLFTEAVQQGDTDRAISQLLDMLDRWGDNVEVLNALTSLLFSTGQHDAALDSAMAAVTLDSGNPDARMNAFVVRVGTGVDAAPTRLFVGCDERVDETALCIDADHEVATDLHCELADVPIVAGTLEHLAISAKLLRGKDTNAKSEYLRTALHLLCEGGELVLWATHGNTDDLAILEGILRDLATGELHREAVDFGEQLVLTTPSAPKSQASASYPSLDEMLLPAGQFNGELVALKRQLAADDQWYPYGSMSNFEHLNNLLAGDNRNLLALNDGRRVADLGFADGDTAFFLNRYGVEVDMIDYAPTNWNGLRGARLLKDALDSPNEIYDIDIDSQFDLPHDNYGLVLFLGILYHLKNPFYALEKLAQSTEYCLVSTRVVRYNPDHNVDLQSVPAAYLVHPSECNNDSTNYWMFTNEGLRRIFDRAGWEIVEYRSFGNTTSSDPVAADADERAFALLRSKQNRTA